MAKWQTLEKQADKLKTDVEELYAQVEEARCSQRVRVVASDGHYRDTRCLRDADHSGVHHVE